MLLGFGGKNFYSFKEGFDITLEHKDEILSVLGVKGANASGKTNVIRALSYIKMFMSDSFSQIQPDEGMKIKPFFESEENSELYIHFKKDDIEYKYEIEFTKEKLIKEVLSRKESRWTTILKREERGNIECIKELDEIKNINLSRSNVSTISLSHQYGLKELEIFYNFSKNITTNVSLTGKLTNYEHIIGVQNVSKIYFNDNILLNIIANFLNKADTGVDKIEILELEDKITKELIYEPLFYHKVDGDSHRVLFHDESNGTQLLYRQLATYYNALKYGFIIAYDEFDIGLHPDLSLMIIELFNDKEVNKNGAQLIFTSHHSEVIDKLGKYRLVFVNKDYNESYLYRLDEIPGDILRPDRSILPAYNSHKIGGRPKVVAHG